MISMPLGTVARDVYEDSERDEVYEALKELVAGWWHKAGVYCFWDPASQEPFYVGLTNNLATRFAQHNSLRGFHPGPGNKGARINDWLAANPRIGFSVVLQEETADEDYEPYAANAEGQLLEGYRQVHGRHPPWNEIGGSRVGAGYVRGNSAVWIDAMTGRQDSLLVARRTIRGMNENAGDEYSELLIHPARTALMHFGPIDDRAILRAVGSLISRAEKYNSGGEDLADRLFRHLDQPAPHPERRMTA